MKGRIIGIEEIEDGTRGYARRQIVVAISEPIMTQIPQGYVTNWRDIREPVSRAPWNKGIIESFVRYEEEMKSYRQKTDELGSFHIGTVEIVQAKEEQK